MSDLTRPIETTLLLQIVDSVLAALDVSHSAGHPHRDVKPPNVIELEDELGQARWVLADWGLTRRAPAQRPLDIPRPVSFSAVRGSHRQRHIETRTMLAFLEIFMLWGNSSLGRQEFEPIPNVSPTVVGPWQRRLN